MRLKRLSIGIMVLLLCLCVALPSTAAVYTYSYDLSGRLVNVTNPDNGYTHLIYDNAGNIVRWLNSAGGIVDSDGDGIDDAWEMRYFNNLTTATATSDWDGDGYTDLQEYLNWYYGENDPDGFAFDPEFMNAPGGTGYVSPLNNIVPILFLLLE